MSSYAGPLDVNTLIEAVRPRQMTNSGYYPLPFLMLSRSIIFEGEESGLSKSLMWIALGEHCWMWIAIFGIIGGSKRPYGRFCKQAIVQPPSCKGKIRRAFDLSQIHSLAFS